MKALIKNEMYRAFRNKKFAAVMFVEIVIVIWFVIEKVNPIITRTIPFLTSMLDTGKVSYIPGAYYIWIALLANPFSVVLYAVMPILTAIPYGATLYEDEKSSYVNQILICNKRYKFYTAKLITFFVSGGVVAVFPFLLSFMISSVLLPFEEIIPATGVFIGNIVAFSGLFYSNTPLYVAVFFLYLFVGYGILNTLCFVATYLFENRFVVMLFPFAIYFILEVIGNFFGGRNITPWLYLRMRDVYKTDIPVILAETAVFLIVILGTFLWKASRKGRSI